MVTQPRSEPSSACALSTDNAFRHAGLPGQDAKACAESSAAVQAFGDLDIENVRSAPFDASELDGVFPKEIH